MIASTIRIRELSKWLRTDEYGLVRDKPNIDHLKSAKRIFTALRMKKHLRYLKLKYGL